MAQLTSTAYTSDRQRDQELLMKWFITTTDNSVPMTAIMMHMVLIVHESTMEPGGMAHAMIQTLIVTVEVID